MIGSHVLRATMVLALCATVLSAQSLSEPWRQKLRAAYNAPEDAPFEEWFAGLSAEDDATRNRAVALAIGLLAQAIADQESGSRKWRPAAPWHFSPWVSHDTPANRFRSGLFKELMMNRHRYGTATIPILRWAIVNDVDAADAHGILNCITTSSGPEWNALLVDAAVHAKSTHVQWSALRQVVRDALPMKADSLDRLAHHFYEEIRVLARRHAKRLGHSVSAPFDRVRCVQSPAIQAMFTRAERHIPFLPPAEARFVVATLDYRPPDFDDEDGEPPVRIVRGWLLAEDDDTWTIFTPLGERVVAQKAAATYRATVRARTIEAEIERIERQLLKNPDRDGPIDFEESSVHEFMIATWLRRQGQHELVARLLVPWLEYHGYAAPARFMRCFLGPRWVLQMAHAFVARDRVRAERLARELIRHFPRDVYHPIARRVLRELERHPNDFRTLTLPTPDAWAATAAKLARPERIRYLLERLRLITHSESAYKIGSSRAVFPDAPQRAKVAGVGPVPPFGFAAPIRWRGEPRINPFIELVGREDHESDRRIGGLSLTVADIPTIAPFLLDDGLMRCVRVWTTLRDIELLPVGRAVTPLIEVAAGFRIIDDDSFEALSVPRQRAEVARLIEWAKRCHDRPEAERLLAFVRSAVDADRPFEWPETGVVEILVKRKTPGTASLLARWLDAASHEPRQRTALLRAVVQLDGKLAAKRAVRFASDASDYVRLVGAVVLFEHGDPSAGLAAIERSLRGLSANPNDDIDGSDLQAAIRALLAKKTADANRVAGIALERNWLDAPFAAYRTAILRDFIAAGMPDAYEYCARRLLRISPIARRKFARELFTEIAKDRIPASVRTNHGPLFTKLILWCLQEADRIRSARPR